MIEQSTKQNLTKCPCTPTTLFHHLWPSRLALKAVRKGFCPGRRGSTTSLVPSWNIMCPLNAIPAVAIDWLSFREALEKIVMLSWDGLCILWIANLCRLSLCVFPWQGIRRNLKFWRVILDDIFCSSELRHCTSSGEGASKWYLQESRQPPHSSNPCRWHFIEPLALTSHTMSALQTYARVVPVNRRTFPLSLSSQAASFLGAEQGSTAAPTIVIGSYWVSSALLANRAASPYFNIHHKLVISSPWASPSSSPFTNPHSIALPRPFHTPPPTAPLHSQVQICLV